jgi:hypothetical protein
VTKCDIRTIYITLRPGTRRRPVADMSVSVNVTPDRERVSIALLEDGKHLGWIEFAGKECDGFLKLVSQYRAMLTDVLPASTTCSKT